MTWNPREYLQKVEAMFEGVTGDVERIGKEFIAIAGERLVLNTPGPGLQYALTEYIATGRLRAGWSFGSNPPDSVSQFARLSRSRFPSARNGRCTKRFPAGASGKAHGGGAAIPPRSTQHGATVRPAARCAM